MNMEEFVEDVDDPVNVGDQNEVKVEHNSCLNINSGEEVLQFVSLGNEQLLKYNGNLVTLGDGSLWYKFPVTLAGEKDELYEPHVEIWEDFEIKNDVKIEGAVESVEEQTVVKDNVPVAAEVIVLDNGTIAYITQPSNPAVPGAEEEGEPKLIKKKSKSHYCTEPGCERSYSSLHHLKVHVRNHTGDRPYKCPVEGCDKAFATHYSRKAHLRTHTGEKPYPCTRCNKSFKTSGDLQKHIRTHTGERPFICPVEGCNRSFTTSNIRKVHIRTHTGERPYTCKFENCNRSFASSTNYKNHMRIHSGEKPFCCPVANCEKRFTEYSSLYKHQLVHSQIKRYKCPFCCKMYRQMSTLTTHKRTIHGVISADDGTEITLEEVIGEGKDALKNFKSIAINLLNLKKDRNTLVTFGEEEPVYIVTEGNNENTQ